MLKELKEGGSGGESILIKRLSNSELKHVSMHKLLVSNMAALHSSLSRNSVARSNSSSSNNSRSGQVFTSENNETKGYKSKYLHMSICI